jgi:hypothetical protein
VSPRPTADAQAADPSSWVDSRLFSGHEAIEKRLKVGFDRFGAGRGLEYDDCGGAAVCCRPEALEGDGHRTVELALRIISLAAEPAA